jgi:hypothetical protein
MATEAESEWSDCIRKAYGVETSDQVERAVLNEVEVTDLPDFAPAHLARALVAVGVLAARNAGARGALHKARGLAEKAELPAVEADRALQRTQIRRTHGLEAILSAADWGQVGDVLGFTGPQRTVRRNDVLLPVIRPIWQRLDAAWPAWPPAPEQGEGQPSPSAPAPASEPEQP